jgi:hypothetical protein
LRYVVSNPETKQSHVVGGHFGVPIFLHIKKAPMNNPANDPHSEGFVLDPRRWLAMAVLLIAGFMNLIDITIVNVALPSLQKGLGASSSQIEWVVAAYVLAFALGLLPFGRLGDIVGRKTIFLWGVAGFTIGSFLCGIAPSINILIVARVLQGLAGAMMMPQVLAIMQVTFPPEERGFACRAYCRRPFDQRQSLRPRLAANLSGQHPDRYHRRDCRMAARPGDTSASWPLP